MDIKKLDLNLLVALDALLDERNVTRAADRLSLSQPALSAALARLRALVGDQLFIRAQRGLVPTPLGDRVGALGKTNCPGSSGPTASIDIRSSRCIMAIQYRDH